MDPRPKLTRQELMDGIREYYALRKQRVHVKELNYLEELLSPVRHQRNLSVCALVSSVTCMEMLYRKYGHQINGSDIFFDIDDLHNHLYHVYPNKIKADSPKNDGGSKVTEVFKYMKDPGLLPMSFAGDAREKNLFSKICTEHKREKIVGHQIFHSLDEAFLLCKEYPIITKTPAYCSMRFYKEIIYYGPAKGEEIVEFHAMLIVGNATLVIDGRVKRFFIVQNSWGNDFGRHGIALVPCTTKFFYSYYLPIIKEPMPRAVYSSEMES